jgi:tetratricopeptide (TPR) repeat protein
MKTLYEHLLELVDDLRINEVFELLKIYSKESPDLTNLVKEYIQGKKDVDYHERLKLYIGIAIDKRTKFEEDRQGGARKQAKHLAYYFPNDFFIGREDDMQKLLAYLHDGKRALLLNGLGGIGKTSLAREYAHQYQTDYDHIVWLQQSGDLLNAFLQRDLLENLAIIPQQHENMQDIFSKVLAALKDLQGTNLLIVDNCEDVGHKDTLEVLRRLFALPTHWHILLTSREAVPDVKGVVLLDVLPDDKAIDLFTKHAEKKPCDRLEVHALLKMAGFHTLMTELWAKTYNESFEFESVAEFAQAVGKHGLAYQAIQEDISIKGQETRLYAHLRETFSVAKLAETEVWLLKLWAVLPTAPHKAKDFFVWIGDEARTHKEPLKKLLKRGWLQTKDNIAYYMHPALQMVLLKTLKPTYEDCKPLCEYIIKNAEYEKVEKNPLAHKWLIPVMESVSQSIDYESCPEIEAFVLSGLGNVYYALGDFDKALEYDKDSLAIWEKIPDKNALGYCTALSNIAYSYYETKKPKEALDFYQKALIEGKESLGESHPRYLKILNGCALAHKALGDYDKALLLCQEALEKRKEYSDAEPIDYSTSLHNLANLYMDMGDYAKALPLYQEVLEKQGRILGAQHPEYATSLYNLGIWHYRQGRQAEALPYFEEAHKICCDTLGEGHPDTKLVKKVLDLTKAELGIE